MSIAEWLLEATLLLALVAALPMAARLERALVALKRDRGSLADSARSFADATREAEAAIARLRATADSAGRGLGEQIQAAGLLREDLRFLAERAEATADRLDAGLRAARGAPAEPPPIPRARAEADLLRALRRGHGT